MTINQTLDKFLDKYTVNECTFNSELGYIYSRLKHEKENYGGNQKFHPSDGFRRLLEKYLPEIYKAM